jgi:prepilin-type N-terminal cleavage/methylation domain-containing protein/prepilin-type processing-associated H-X9-DG protein
MNRAARQARGGFTLVEMLVVVGIIGFLIALLLPALSRAQAQAKTTQCMSNMRQVGMDMLIYAQDNNEFLFPPNKGWPGAGAVPDVIANTNPPQYDVWPYYVCNHVWNPPIMTCPADYQPLAEHSYFVNAHLMPKSMAGEISPTTNPSSSTDQNFSTNPSQRDLMYSSILPRGRSPSDVIVMGEKRTDVDDYYMEVTETSDDWTTKVEQHRHGFSVGSNYLMLDLHVETQVPGVALGGLDPWDPNGTPTTAQP